MTGEDLRPPRPHLPPLLVAGLVLWGATALLWPALAGASTKALVAGGTASLAAAVAVAACLLRRGTAPLGAVALLALLVAAASSCAGAATLHGGSAAARDGAGLWYCTLTTDAKPGDFGWQAEARVRDGSGAVVPVRLYLPEDGAGLLQGDRVRVEGSFREPAEESRDFFWNGGLAGSISSTAWEREGEAPPLGILRQRAIAAVAEHGGRGGALVQALVCGYRAPLELADGYAPFQTVGLAHLVAVSGAHLSLVTMFVAQLLRFARLGRRATAVVTALFLAAYVGCVGMPVSALRAAVMAATALLALVADRRSSALNALGLCLVVFVGLDPSCALSASFALSAGSTLGIVLLAPLLSSLAAGRGKRLRSLVVEPVVLTVASALATQPYAAALFSQVPLLAPVANVMAAPLFALACTGGFAAVVLACLVPALAPAAVGCAVAAARPLEAVVAVLARAPGSCLPVDVEALPMVALSAILVGGLWAWWPVVRARAVGGIVGALAALLLAATASPALAAGPDEIVMLDVGQGDAFLLRSQGATLLIDTGNRDGLLKEAIARQGIHRIDRVAITHADDDHCGSLQALGDVTRVGGLLVADDLLSCPCENCTELVAEAEGEAYPGGIEGLSVGDAVGCGRFTLEVVWPDAFDDEGGNGDSLSFLCRWDGDGDGEADWTALFCGDAEAEELAAMAPALPPEGVDVLKVGHHGSRRSLDENLARRLAPAVALVGVGQSNRYGHPAPEVLDALTAVGAQVLCSDEVGDASIAFSMEKLSVTTQKGADPPPSGTMGP